MKISNAYSFVAYTGGKQSSTDGNNGRARVPVTQLDSFTRNSDSSQVTKPETKKKTPVVTYSDKEDDAAKAEFKTLIHADYNFRNIEETSELETVYYLGSGSQAKIEAVDAWKDFLTNPKNKIPYPEKVLILKGVMQNVELYNCTCPLALKPKTVFSVLDEYRKSPDRDTFNFHDRYQEEIRKPYLRKVAKEGDEWIVIPSKSKDPENYEKNVAKLQILSEDVWDTNSYVAEDTLKEGDFHLLIRNGKPLVGMGMLNGKVSQFYGKGKEGELIPTSSLDAIDAHLEETKLDITYGASSQIDLTRKKEKEINLIKDIIAMDDEDGEEGCFSLLKTERILNALHIGSEPDGNGKLRISHYGIPEKYRGEDLGLDENLLFKNISMIKGNADFAYSNVTDLGILRTIGGDANFGYSKLKTPCELRKVKGNFNASHSNLETLGKIETIGKDLNLEYSKVKSTGALKYVGGSAYYSNSKLTSTEKLEHVGKDLCLSDSEIIDVKGLKQVDGSINTYNSKLYKKDFLHVKSPQNKGLSGVWIRLGIGDKQ